MGFVIFFIFFAIKLSRPHDMGCGFGGMTRGDSTLITGGYMFVMLTQVDLT